MTEQPLDLASHLAACYREKHSLGPKGAIADFAAALKADAGLRASAEARLAEIRELEESLLGGKLEQRDYISAAHRDAINTALAAAK